MFFLLIGILILIIIDLVLVTVLQARINGVMPVKNLIVNNKAYFGVELN